jgi:hypothetical protein
MIARTALLTVVLLVGAAHEAAAANPWQLRCPSMPTEQPSPTALRPAALRFYPWVRPAARSLEAGPIYLVALSSDTAISRDGDDTDSAHYYLHRTLIAVAPSYPGAVTISGRRLTRAGRRAALGFSQDGATSCAVRKAGVTCGYRPLRFAATLRIPPSGGWRIVPTELRIGRTGCFELSASGAGLHETIPLSVPGPDYGSVGW